MNGELPMLEARFLAHIDVERGLSAATVQAYENDIDQYVRWLGEQGIAKAASITSNDVEDFVAAQSKSGTSAVSLARRLASIHMFHRFMQSERVVADDVSQSVRPPKSAETLPEVLTVDEVQRLLDAARHDDASEAVSMRDSALLELMYATGCRVSEAVGLDFTDVDMDAQVVRLTGKGAKQRLVPFGTYAANALRDLPEQTRQAAHPAVGVGDHQACRCVGTCEQTPASAHAEAFLRHTYAAGRRRCAHRAGAARARLGEDDANVHACQPGHADRDVHHLASPCEVVQRAIYSAHYTDMQ